MYSTMDWTINCKSSDKSDNPFLVSVPYYKNRQGSDLENHVIVLNLNA